MSCLVCSKLQEEIALSNREAEYIVLSKLIRNVIHFMSPMKEILFIFDINLMKPEIYYKCFKDNRSCIDTTQSFKMRTKAEEFFEEFLGQEASLWEHVHDSPDFNVDATILGGFVAEIVEFNDLLWGVVQLEEEVFVSFHWSVEVEVRDVNGHKFCAGRRYDAAEQDLDDDQFCRWGTNFFGVVNFISAYGESCLVG